MKIAAVTLALLGIALSLSAPARAGSSTQYDSVIKAIESGGDYSREKGTLVLLSNNPLRIQMSPMVVRRDFPEVIEEMVKRTIVEGFVVAFAQTSVSELSITAVPIEFNFKSKAKRTLTGYARTVSVTRARFDELVRKYLEINSCRDLVGNREIDGHAYPDMMIEATDRIVYNDAGYPGLTRFFGELAK